MDETGTDRALEIRVFGALRKHLDNQDLPYFIRKQIAPNTYTPVDIAGELKLPQDEIEGVFINGKVGAMQTVLSPGDRIAFLPYGTPGPYRLFLGIVNRAEV